MTRLNADHRMDRYVDWIFPILVIVISAVPLGLVSNL
jgi:hypothetical protein